MATGQSRFTKRYTDTQKNALLKAVIVEKRTVADAIKRAETGDLGVPAFTLNRVYAYEIVKREREAYEQANPDAMSLAIDDTIALLASKGLRLARNVLKDDNATPEEIKRAITTLKAAQHATKQPATPEPKPTPGAGNDTPSTADVISGLLNQANGARGPVASDAR